MKIQLTFRSYDKILLVSFIEQWKFTLNYFNISYSIVGLPTTIRRYTVLRSPHIDKKARDQWEQRQHSFYFIFLEQNQLKLQFLCHFLVRFLPAGIGVKLHRQQFLFLQPSLTNSPSR